jgi:hypothetical protein
MTTKTETKFVVKSVKPGRKEGDKPFYAEVGRLTIRETEKGVSGSLYLHMFSEDYAVFPVEPKKDDAPAE